MSTDRELLELAAKAAGFDFVQWSSGTWTFGQKTQCRPNCGDVWNPLDDDGDARLLEAYKHGIQTVINSLHAADRSGIADTQVRALHAMGGEAQAVAADISYNKLKNSGGLHAIEAARTARDEAKWSQQ